MEDSKHYLIRNFQNVCHDLLSDSEQFHMYKVLKDYQSRRKVDRLVAGICHIATEKQPALIEAIHNIIPKIHLPEFEWLIEQNQNWRRNTTPAGSIQGDLFDDEDIEGDLYALTLHKLSNSQRLGFSVRGGSEHGLGIYISEVEDGSAADKAGFEVGDKILEVNKQSFHNLSSSVAISLLTKQNYLNMTVERTGKLPKWRLAKEKTAWYDSLNKEVVCGEFEKCGTMHYIRGLDLDIPERRVTLTNTGVLGLNIRGGNEFGLGIYVSSVDHGGMAEERGVREGDQIIDVNGVQFDNISHADAVDVLKSQEHIILTLRDVGRYPAFKEIYGEYKWTRLSNQNKMKETRLHDTRVIQSSKNPALHMKVPVEILSPSQDSHHSDGLPLQSEIYLPNAKKDERQSQMLSECEDDLSTVSLDIWKYSEGFQNPAYNPGMQQNSEDDVSMVSDTDNESDIHGEYSVMTLGEPQKVDNMEMVELSSEMKQGAIIDETRISEDEAICVMNNMPCSDFSDSCCSSMIDKEEKLSISSECCSESSIKDYKACFDDENILKFEEAENLAFSPLSSRSSSQNKPDRSDDENNQNLNSTWTKSNFQNSPIQDKKNAKQKVSFASSDHLSQSSCYSDDSNHEQFPEELFDMSNGKDEVDADEIQKENLFRLPEIDPYLPMKRQESTGFDVNEEQGEENSVMREFDRQISDLETDQSTLGIIEMTELTGSLQKPDVYSAENKELIARGKALKRWNFLREKIKGSLRIKPLSRKGLEKRLMAEQEKDATRRDSKKVLTSAKVIKTTVSAQSLKDLEEAAEQVLSSDECITVMRHIREYHSCHDLDSLVEVLLALLDSPEKLLLLREIRSVIYPVDIYRFELSVNRYEVEAYEKLSTKVHLHLNHDKDRRPKKHLLHAEIDEYGHFYIKPMEQHSKEQKIKQHVIEAMTSQKGFKENLTGEDSGITSQASSLRLQEAPLESDVSSVLSMEISAKNVITAYISKNKPNLGLCVSGGSESRIQPEIKVEEILEGGAAADEPAIKPGMVILTIDGQNMVGVKHSVAVEALRVSFGNKRRVNMKIQLWNLDLPEP